MTHSINDKAMNSIKTIDLPFSSLQEAFDSATEAEEWFSELYVSETNNHTFRVTDFKPPSNDVIHLTLIDDKIKLITSEARKLS